MAELIGPPSQPTTSSHTISPDIPIHPVRRQIVSDERLGLMGRLLDYVGGGRRRKIVKLNKPECAQPEPRALRIGTILELRGDPEVPVFDTNKAKVSLGCSSPSDPSHAKRHKSSSGSHYLESPPVYSATVETACTLLPSVALEAPCHPRHMSLPRISQHLPPLQTPPSTRKSHPHVRYELEHAKAGGCGAVAALSVSDTPKPEIPVKQPVFHNTLEVLCSEALPTAFVPSSNWVLLQQYARELATLDCISGLIHTREYRGKLFTLAESLGVTGNPMFRQAVQQDESDIAKTLRYTTASKIHRQSILALEGVDAQKFVDVGQEVLDRGLLVHNDDSSMVLGLLIRLCERCHKLPTSILLHGVTDVNTAPIFSGGFGDLFRGTHDGTTVALKKLRIFNRNRTGDAKIRKRFCQEALLWHGLKHPHIVPFLGVDIESFPSSFCLVSPWMRHGTVLDHLKDCGRSNINKTIYEIIQGLLYLHSRKIIHGDLRGANILVNDDWEACLTDFGLTVFNDPAATAYSSRHDGSIRWMAPELHDPKSFGLSGFRLTPATDIYSFAYVCLELYTGLPPFPNLKLDTAVLLAVLAGGRPKRPYVPIAFPDEIWTIVECCWCSLPSDRMSTQTVANAMQRFLSSPTSNVRRRSL